MRNGLFTYRVLESISMGTRYTFGPSQDAVNVASDTPDGPTPPTPIEVKLDGIEKVDGVQTVRVVVPPTDPAFHERPNRVFAVFGFAPPEASETPSAYLSRSGHATGFAVVPEDNTVPAFLAIPVPEVAPGVYFVQTVLEWVDAA